MATSIPGLGRRACRRPRSSPPAITSSISCTTSQNSHLDPAAAGFAAVIYGHSHQPAIESRDDVLFLNPGSAGPRRFTLPVTLARVRISDGVLHPDIIILEP
ncbi:MAG: metallophosphoesterase family protein [Xanthobacteraceae bacterium]